MRRWLEDLSYKMQTFMQGRYGRDELTRVLIGAAFVFLILSLFRPLGFFSYIALAILIWDLFRTFSKNHAGRQKERDAYLKIKNTVTGKFRLLKGMWRDRNTHIYVKCPNCRTMIRLAKPPKGKHIMITCPKCRNSFEKHT
ncbi:MAG: hypothetical protein IJ106_02760 [Parasporobacterium sp.]|nr:hypothetical protein [Parasporobacterium sp.]